MRSDSIAFQCCKHLVDAICEAISSYEHQAVTFIWRPSDQIQGPAQVFLKAAQKGKRCIPIKDTGDKLESSAYNPVRRTPCKTVDTLLTSPVLLQVYFDLQVAAA